MATVTTGPERLSSDLPAGRGAHAGASRGGGRLGVTALLVVAAAGYVVLALRSSAPVMAPDEYRYTQLAKSLAAGDGFAWRGEPLSQTAALYVYLIAPIWKLFGSTSDAYNVTKAFGALCMTATAIPVWLLARELLDRRLAVLCAALSVTGTWMPAAAMTVTEVIAYPCVTTALCLTVMALRRPGSRLGYVVLGFALVATWARLQVIVVVPAIFAAFALDALRYPGGRRAALARHRTILVAGGGATAVLAAIALAAHSALGDYHVLFGFRPPMGLTARRTGLQLLELVAAGGFVPVLLAAAGAASARAWRDPRTGPLLLVFWLATAAFVLQSGWYLASIGLPGGIERYATYPLPLAFVLTAVLATQPGLLSRASVVPAGALLLALLAVPATLTILIEPATWSSRYRVHELLGIPSGAALAVTGAALLAITALILRRARRPAAAATAVCAVVLAMLLVEGQATWDHLITTSRSQRAQLPADAQWVDHHARGPVAVLGIMANSAAFLDLDFFSRSIDAFYLPANGGLAGPPPFGGRCAWSVAPTGEVQSSCGGRPTQPHAFLVNDPYGRVTFQEETSSVREPHLGRLVTVPATGPARVRSLVTLPCPTPPLATYFSDIPAIIPADAPHRCRHALDLTLWLDRPADVLVRFVGGRRAQVVRLGHRRWAIPAGRMTTVRFRVPAGATGSSLDLDWDASDGTPAVLAVELVQDHRRIGVL